MKTLFSILLIAFLFSCSGENVNKKLLVFELRLAESESNPDLKEMILYNSDQKFFVHDSVFLSNNDITSAEIIDWQTQPKVKLVLNDKGRKKFADYTLKNIGKNAAMLVDNKLVSAPRINAQITQGILIIVGFFNHEEAIKISDGILPKR